MTKVFNKRNAKRVTAILLAVVAVVSSIFIIPTASAAGKEVTVTFDYCYDTGGNIISFVKYTEHGGYTVGTVGEELCRIYADGKDAYCIEPGHSLYSGNTLTTDASAAWNALSKAQKKAVNLALLFGKSGSSSSLVGTDGQKWIATQLVVWEFCTGCRDASTFKLSNSKFIDGITAGDHNPNVKTNYNKIITKLNSYNVIPSFSYDTQAKAKNSVKELKYSDGKYSLTLTDSNKILSDYTFKKTGDVSVSVSGNSITLTSTKAIPDALVFSATKKMPNVTTTLVACGSSSKQDVVTGVQSDTETKTAYFAVKTSAGSLKIVKTSDDGKVDGVKFKVTGADNYSKTVTTNAKGEFQIDDLKVGTYTVTEVTEERYEDQKSQTVKVESGKTATVKFSNILKRGDLEVVKTSEDNFNEGVKFHLYGTSLSGANVDEYATTDKNGVANFKNILVSGDKPYTLEEVDTATRYVVPKSQTTPITWDKVAKREFTNTLKKFIVEVAKVDSETKKPQGDASLAGAKYGIYDGDKLIDTYTTDKDGKFTTKEYVCGDNWTIREIEPSEGYQLDKTVYPVGAEAKKYTIEHNKCVLSVNEDVIKGDIEIVKHTDQGQTKIETPEEGATFQLFLKSAGSFDNAHESVRDTLVCDEKGYAKSKKLPYGTYTVHQSYGWEGRHYVDDFDVYVCDNSKPYSFIINNDIFESYLKVVKVDAESGKTIPYEGAGFQIYAPDNTLITMSVPYPSNLTIDTFYTNSEGYLITPEMLVYDKGYKLVEVQAPHGYVLDSTPITFDITEENSTEEGSIVLTKVNKANYAQKGKITIAKEGEVFYGVNVSGGTDDEGNTNIKAYRTYGTDRINAYRIIEETLNLKDVRIFDYVEDEFGKRKPVLNKKETTIALQKQELIKEGFREWIWKDPQRRERLCKIYNEKFNSTRPREYDGSHITFSGMNPEIELREHQKNAVAHILYGGNTLLAHAVGAGKTFEMTAAAMESKRLGLCSKSLFVVPNHLTEQWAAEFLQLYPAANILVATKKDFETANRKRFCGRIATGDYDAIIIGHSQFEKIPMSIERQRALLEQQIDEITDGIAELKENRGDNFSIKQLEKTRKSIKVKLQKLNDQTRKDDVVTFEELGVDRLFIDESHYYKNLYLYTKMRNVGGIAQTEAQKSSDLFMKCRYLDEITGGRGTVFATGTPISNSMVELYTIQRYLQYETLVENGLQHFDAWASTFGETVTAYELKPEGTGYRTKTRFAKFYNLPELMAMFKQVADIKTADTLNLPTPTPHYHNVAVKPSEMQKTMVADLAERAEKVRGGNVDPSVDNMLKITNDGRKLALDQRMINPMLPDNEGSKINACVDNIFTIWQDNTDKKSAQLVFCDLSTPKPDAEFSVYTDIRQKLIERGVPESEIRFIHEAKTEVQKQELFKKVRKGEVRVLLGSTQKMGAGTNVQNKLIALHDIDCPWRPSDLEQRSGRIIRQGNENPDVEIYRYVTEETFDAYLYQLVEGKQKFAAQIMTSKSPVRTAEDIDDTALSYAEIKMLATGNPYIKEKMDLDIQVNKLKMLKSYYLSQKYDLEDKIIKFYPQEIALQTARIKGLKADLEIQKTHPKEIDGKFVGMTIQGTEYKDKAEAGKAIIEFCKTKTNADTEILGEYRGFKMEIEFNQYERAYVITLRENSSLGTKKSWDMVTTQVIILLRQVTQLSKCGLI